MAGKRYVVSDMFAGLGGIFMTRESALAHVYTLRKKWADECVAHSWRIENSECLQGDRAIGVFGQSFGKWSPFSKSSFSALVSEIDFEE
jgi:hypothetical protein